MGKSIHGELLRRLCRVRDVLHDDLASAHDLSALGRAAGISRHHLLRVFRQAFGETPHAYLTRLRLEKAKTYLRAGRSVTQTCFEVGFASLGSFSTLFRRHVHVPPVEYQRRLRTTVAQPEFVETVAIPFCFAGAFVPQAARIATLEKPLSFRP